MKVALVNSRQDLAGCTIRRHIEEILGGGAVPDTGRTYEFFEVDGGSSTLRGSMPGPGRIS